MGNKLLEWNHLVARMANINLQQGNDSFIWSLHKLTEKTWQRGIGMEIGPVVFKQTHLFFECSRVMFLWRAIHMAIEMNPPRNAQNLSMYGTLGKLIRIFYQSY